MKTLSLLFILSLSCLLVSSPAAEPLKVTLRLRGVPEFFPVTQILENNVVVKMGDGKLKTVGLGNLLPEDQAKVLPEMRRQQAERQAREMAALPPPPVKPVETEAQMKARQAAARTKKGTLRTLDGTLYTEVFLREVDASSITIDHASGLARIPHRLLPAEVMASLRDELTAKEDTAKVLEQQEEKMRGQTEWEQAQRSTKALAAHSLSGRVMERHGDGALIARLTLRPDITVGLYGFVEGVSGKAAGESFTGRVKRSGVWTAIDGKTYPKYVISR